MLTPIKILTAREMYYVRTEAAYRLWQRGIMFKHRAVLGDAIQPVVSHDVATPIAAQVRQGRWIVVCPCGNHPGVDIAARLACCPDCGAVYVDVVLPDDRELIEGLLIARPVMATRNWLPGETAARLEAENSAHGVHGLQSMATDGNVDAPRFD